MEYLFIIIMFFVLLLVTLLLNYLIFKCLIKKKKLKKSFIYKDIEYHNEKYNDNCIICQDDYNENDICSELYCSHKYHYKCLEEWFKHDKFMKCPLCNLPLMTKYNNKRLNELNWEEI